MPGAGCNGKDRVLMDGKAEGDKTVFVPVKTQKRYLGRTPEQFAAARKYQRKDYTATIAGGKLTGKTDTGRAIEAKKVVRQSPTLGAKPPAGAVVLFDGTSPTHFAPSIRRTPKHELMTEDGLLREGVDGKRRFQSFTLHLEFRTPFKPYARGQGRGNSGFYAQGRYEVQILDSFGLESRSGDCGGIYSVAPPKVNMCLPPLSWQTYDVDFTAAEFDAKGKKVKNARMTVRHNGVLVHDDVEVPRATTSCIEPESPRPGPVHLQNHGNPVRFRNIWLVEKK